MTISFACLTIALLALGIALNSALNNRRVVVRDISRKGRR